MLKKDATQTITINASHKNIYMLYMSTLILTHTINVYTVCFHNEHRKKKQKKKKNVGRI